MMQLNKNYDSINQIITDGVSKGILHLYTEDKKLQDNYITLKDKSVVNFGSCSYLGLEFDPRLQQGAIEAVQNYGTQFSASRAYVSVTLYRELECCFNQIFSAFTVITPTTTLGHIATIPIIVADTDAVILDHQVHHSVQTAVALVKSKGVHTELVRHNRIDLLEERILHLRKKYKTIWYMADGIYSMYGDKCPVDKIYSLLNKYPELHFYVDDAHGMSVYGKYGQGYVLHNRSIHPKMVVATSLAKSFATGGAVMIFPTNTIAQRVRTCGGPMITSGPMQPAQLGAALAAAKIHLSSEIITMQNELQDRIAYTKLLLLKYNLPVLSDADAAVFFIGVSLPKAGYQLVSRMLEAGYYVNLGIFPAVPMKNTGIRFTITRLHSLRQIEEMVMCLANEFEKVIQQEGISLKEIYEAFKIPCPEETALVSSVHSVLKQSLDLKTYSYKSIQEIDKKLWNNLFGNKGNFDYEGLLHLEEAFTANHLPEENWEFDYILVKDQHDEIILATFLTTTIWKDDMLAPAEISYRIETERQKDKYFLTSTVISTGSLLTEGEHLFIQKQSPLWKEAFLLFLDKVKYLQEKNKTDKIVLRDFKGTDSELDSFLVDNGFFKFAMPDNHIMQEMNWENETEFYQQLSRCSKNNFRKHIRRNENHFETNINPYPSKADLTDYYQLYLNVKNHSLSLNTYTLPFKVFYGMAQNKNWEIITLHFKTEEKKELAAMVFCYKTEKAYIPMIIGMNYAYNSKCTTYRQALYQVMKRAKSLKLNQIHFGFSAGIEKKKLGAKAVPTHGYMQSKDNFNFQVMDHVHQSSMLITAKSNAG